MKRTFTSFLTLVLVFTLMASPAMAAKKDGFSKGATTAELQEKYEEGKIRILIAAGHEPQYGGAVYQGVYEREITVDIAEELEELLEDNPNYEVIVTRSDSAWNKSLQKYFTKKKTIEKFISTQKKKMEKLLKKKNVSEGGESHGVAAPTDVALRLYGINKWANENDIDLVVNLHVNDAPDHGPNVPSKHSGYAVYVPDRIYGNSKTAKDLGNDIADRLEALSDVSTHPSESAGVVEHREFIAVGAFGTLNIPSVLIEYGYITEPRFADTQYRETLTKDLAYQTYLALQDFFGDPVKNPRKVKKLPTKWPEPVIVPAPLPVATTTPATITTVVTTVSPTPATTTPVIAPVAPTPPVCVAFTKTLTLDPDTLNEEVKQLQTILAKDKVVYPEGLVTGYFGPATERAVKRFQEKHGIVSSGTAATTGYGAVGPKTAAALLAACK